MLQQFNDALSSVVFDLFYDIQNNCFIKGDRIKLNIEILYYFIRESSTLSILVLKRSVQNLNMLLLKLLFLKTF